MGVEPPPAPRITVHLNPTRGTGLLPRLPPQQTSNSAPGQSGASERHHPPSSVPSTPLRGGPTPRLLWKCLQAPRAARPQIPPGIRDFTFPTPTPHHPSHLPAPRSRRRARRSRAGQGGRGPAGALGGGVGAVTARGLTARLPQLHRGPLGTSGREARRSQAPEAPLLPRRRGPGHCGTCSPAPLCLRPPPCGPTCWAPPAVLCASRSRRGRWGRLWGVALPARGLGGSRVRPLPRQQPEHLSHQTPTSAEARQSTRVRDAVRKALRNSGGPYPYVRVDARRHFGHQN